IISLLGPLESALFAAPRYPWMCRTTAAPGWLRSGSQRTGGPMATNTNVPYWGQLPVYAQRSLAGAGYEHEWFDETSADTRLTVLNLYVKLSGMNLWNYVRDGDLWTTRDGRLEVRADLNPLELR